MTTLRVRRAPDPTGPMTVRVPGSKSIANRAMVCAALARGTSTLVNSPGGDDTRLLVQALSSLGVDVTGDARALDTAGPIDVAGPLNMGDETITVDAGLGGTTSRFLCALAAMREGKTIVKSGDRMRERPMEPLYRALRSLGARVEVGGADGVLATIAGGDISGGSVTISAESSSQFASALMMIGPLMRDGLRIELDGVQRSRSYMEMTAAVMRAFGSEVTTAQSTIEIAPGGYRARRYAVEADFSSAAFPVMASALTGHYVSIPGMGDRSIQGDRRLIDLAEAMSIDVVSTATGLQIEPVPGEGYGGLSIELSNESDLVPPLVLGLLGASTHSSIGGVGFIRGKESNRLEDFAAELHKCGLIVETAPDGLEISPGPPVRRGVLDPRGDHRLAMAFGLIPLIGRRSGTRDAGIGEVTVLHSETVSKSWPTYWEDMAPFLVAESLPS